MAAVAAVAGALPQLLVPALVRHVAFGLLASSVYVQNDLLDLEADRHHARKRFRPFAAGTLPIRFGLLLAPLLIVLSVAIALFLPPAFIAVLGLYFVTTVSYSFYFKRKPILDVLLLSLLYTLRIVAGGAAIGVAPAIAALRAYRA